MKPEVYNQRYETYRHLDKLRWQMLQILIAIASATALVLRSTSGGVEWWFYFLIGFSLLSVSFVMLRIGSGIRANSIVLKAAGEAVGDDGIPDVSNKWNSVAHWIAIAVMVLGLFLVLFSLLELSDFLKGWCLP